VSGQILGLEKARSGHPDKFWTYESQIRCPDKFLKKLLNLGSIRTGIDQKCSDRKPEILTFRDLGLQGIVRGPGIIHSKSHFVTLERC
jgi:hypothetical protein